MMLQLLVLGLCMLFFFFKQKTAYEMRISDWSSDVCSSDLLACLSEEERDLGVALVELGAAVTTVSLYAGGMLVEMASLPFGASDITDYIASAFGIRRSQAQRLQSFYGSASASPRDNNEIIELEPGAPSGGDSPRIPRSEEHTSELQSLMRISYAVFCL